MKAHSGGLVVIAQYPWDGRLKTQNSPTQFLAAAWSRVRREPVLVVNLVPWHTLLRWPRELIWLRPGFRAGSQGTPAILSLWGPSWRAISHEARTHPVRSTASAIRAATERMGLRHPILVAGDPAHARMFGACSEAASVYYSTDDLLAGDPARAESIAYDEQLAISRADLILCVSEALRDRHRIGGRPVHLLPNAVDPHVLRELAEQRAAPPGWDGPPHPRVLYVGSLNRRVDFVALRQAVAAHPDKTFIMVGPLDDHDPETVCAARTLRGLPNVRLLGRRDRDEVAWIAFNCDLGIVPYCDSPFNRACSPLKVLEYAACGLPVVATPLPAIRDFEPAIRLAAPPDLADAIAEELALGRARHVALEELVQMHTWSKRVHELAQLLPPVPGMLT